MALYQAKYRVESSRLRDWDYRSPGWYFVTICTQNRACIFGDVAEHKVALYAEGKLAESELQNLCQHYDRVHVDTSVVMPNHIHAVVVIDGAHRYSPNPTIENPSPRSQDPALFHPCAGSLSTIVRSYKAGVTRLCRANHLTPLVWQPGFYDHILRRDDSLNTVRDYILNNPANWTHDINNPANIKKKIL